MSTKPSPKPMPEWWVDAYVLKEVTAYTKIHNSEYGPKGVFKPDSGWLIYTASKAKKLWLIYAKSTIYASNREAVEAYKDQALKLMKENSCIQCRYSDGPTIECDHIFKTQKSRGLKRLVGIAHHVTGTKVLPITGLITSEGQYGDLSLPAFVRPCPLRPRHGYIDSRVVKTAPALKKLVDEVFADDPQSELMLTPAFPDGSVKFNSIWTPSLLTIGEGNDGATAGKNTISVPLLGIIPKPIKAILKESGVGKDEDPYIEAITTVDATTYLTQLRAGPAGAVVGNYIPEKVKVREILKTNGEELLEWEALIKQVKDKPGLVVYHPGGSPADHYSVHCRCSGVPVIYDTEPSIGDVLEATSSPELDIDEVIQGAIIASYLMTKDPQHLDHRGWASLMLFGFHNNAALGGRSSRLLGASLVAMIRLGMAALAGEARHCESPRSHNLSSNRHEVWRGMDGRSLTELRAIVNKLITVHLFGDFRSAGFGGRKWAQCGISLVPLFNGLRNMSLTEGTDRREAFNTMIKALNVAINQAHNGGWWLNKFIAHEAFNGLQENDPSWICSGHMVPLLYAIMSAETTSPKRATGIWSRWPRLVYDAPALVQADASYDSIVDLFIIQPRFKSFTPGKATITLNLDESNRDEVKKGLLIEIDRDRILVKTMSGVVLMSSPILEPQTEKPMGLKNAIEFESNDDDEDDSSPDE